MSNLYGISGKMGAGKDLVASIIRYLYEGADKANIPFDKWDGNSVWSNEDNEFFIANYRVKKFADKLKDMVCLLIGCTREDLENQDFKAKELGEEWECYRYEYFDGDTLVKSGISIDKPEDEWEFEDCKIAECYSKLINITPRLLLQLLGTDCGRQIIHPNVWVNATFADYEHTLDFSEASKPKLVDGKYEYEGVRLVDSPKWILSDMRFPNELKAVKDRGGVTIRVERYFTSEKWQSMRPDTRVIDPDGWDRGNGWQYSWFEEKISLFEYNIRVAKSTVSTKVGKPVIHESETALDNAEFDHVIINDGSIEELIEKVRVIIK